MNFNKFTIKGQEAVQEAVKRTEALGQQAIEPIHLLYGILKVSDQIASFLLQKCGTNIQQVKQEVEREEQKLPKVTG